ncbi:probable LRR receptor-like serine/threonine-protein kinase At3g47570 [Rhodamnia argentea]|uniref:Probable LRR receptor-like serine/threonine-protein kinase At3g47570 n=1 Tax=Rhodamnia argentea TaxID=178133 RepID=A0A8B8QAR8_9MYRT|nr:probable LRR receptor-like serine/threonine-protein kinase At3g47570 [Rhodamnia argentea]
MEKFMFLAFLDLLLGFLLMSQPAICSSNFTDQDALLHFKSVIEVDPMNMVKGGNWTAEANFCEWIGIVCSNRRQRVVALDLSYMGLQGRLSPYPGNLSFPASLDLRNNSFYGSIPIEIGHLRRLKELILQSNQFEGNIPPNLAQCQNLEVMSLAANQLTGGIPREFGAFPVLQNLFLSFNELGGEIPSFPANISTLQVIGLVMNNLTGSIPPALFNRSLTSVMLTYNDLSGSLPSDLCYRWPNIQRLLLSDNQFSGLLPQTLTQCKELLVLSLSFNRFRGSIPRDIDSLQKLQELYLGTNNLTGTIPRTIGNMSSLHMLYTEFNSIGGNIPSEIGKLVNLNSMSLEDNLLTGEIPQEVFNISSLQLLSLMDNSLSGSLPSSSELSLPNLEKLYLANNDFSGNIPQYFSNFSNLIPGINQLSGPIPTNLGNLKSLRYFAVQSNQLTGETYGSELSFLSALSNCQSLQTLVLEENPLGGSIPESIKNFSSSLQILFAPNCQIRGHIPTQMGFLKNLTFLQLSDNDLDGNIPSSIGGLESLQRLHLDNNHLEGPIPDEICNLTNLGELLLRQNRISGSIPNCIGNLSSLQKFLVSSNNMTSVIPVSLWSLQQLIFLNLSLNSFNGGLPLDMGKMTDIQSIDLSWNRLTGAIPSSIQELKSLSSLNFSRNLFQGSIPQSIGDLKGLDFLDLSYNELSDAIPESLEGLTYLQHLNLSFNKLSGKIPNGGPFGNFSALSFIGNEALCGNATFQVPPCHVNGKKSSRDKRLRLLYIMLPIVSAILLVSIICFFRKRRNTSKKPAVSVENPPGIDHPMISYQELCSGTNNFSESNLLGVGSFSSVYKGTLANGADVAVKVLNLHIEGALKSFDAECGVFRKIRHRNLVKVITTCTNADMRALVLQYVPNGSLEKWLYSNNYNLGLHQRVKIMVDVAAALDYLHHGQPEPVVHCDLKPSNVLLNEDLIAQVCDFGIAKILAENKLETQTRTLGTIGYIAPEYGLEGKVSTKGDVYSFGILLLEVITGKKPTDEIFDAAMRLRQWVGAAIPDRVLDIVDSNLLSTNHADPTPSKLESIVLSILELGLECSRDLPGERMDMETVTVKLNKIKLSLD